MAVSCLAGAFNTGTGALSSTIDITGSITISGVSVVLFFMNGRIDSVDAAGRATRWRGAGWAVTSTDRRCQVSQDADASVAHTGGSYHSDAACIASVPAGTAADGLLDFDSWLSNGFRLIVDDVMPQSYRVGYLIITGLTAAATGQWQDSGTTGDKIITTALGFQPDCEILMASNVDTTPPGGRGGNEMLGLGFAVSTSAQATWCGGADEGSATTDTDSYANDVECLSSETAAAGTTLASRFTFVSHNSNGFTLNQAIVPATICWNHFLALKGGSFNVVSVLTRTDTTTDIVTPALGFTPEGAILLSAMKAEHAAGTMTVHDTWSMGVADKAGNRYSAATFSLDGVGDTVVYTAIEHDGAYISITQSATPVVDGLMDVKTFDSNTITFIMDDADPSAKFVTMLVIGNVAGGAPQTLTATGFANSQAFGTPVVSPQPVTLTATGFANGQSFGTPTVSPQPVTLTATGFANTNAFGSPTVSPQPITLTATGFANTQSFGTPNLALNLTPEGFINSNAFGAPTVTPQPITLTVTGFANSNFFGSPTVVVQGGTQYLTAAGFANAQAFGTPTVSPQPVTLIATGFANTQAFGTPKLALNLTPGGFTNSSAFGSPTVSPQPVTLTATGFANAQAFGSPTVQVVGGTQFLTATGFTNSSAFGIPTVTPGPVTLITTGFVNTNAFGSPTVISVVTLYPTGFADPDGFGSPTVSVLPVTLFPASFVNTNLFGMPVVVGGVQPADIVFVDAIFPLFTYIEAYLDQIGTEVMVDPTLEVTATMHLYTYLEAKLI